MQRLAFLFCLLFTFGAQAGIFDCARSLKKEPFSLTQRDVDELSKAIVYGNVKKIRKLARPLLGVKNHDYKFSNVDLHILGHPSVESSDILVYAANLAIQIDFPEGPIKSLQTLVEMGFKVDASDDSKKTAWGTIASDLRGYATGPFAMTKQQEAQITSALSNAGLDVNAAIQTYRTLIMKQLRKPKTAEGQYQLNLNID